MDLKAIGRRIKAAREVKGLTQEALAELVNFKPHAYLETAGFKLAHLWGFLWGERLLPGSCSGLHTGYGSHSQVRPNGEYGYWFSHKSSYVIALQPETVLCLANV